MQLQPKNWSTFQHYRDRCPPWIKLHRDLLNDRAFMALPLASKALAPLLWLLASESKEGVFDASIEELVFRLRITEKEAKEGLKPLIDKGLFIVASGVLAECYRDAIPEREGETETETESLSAKPTQVRVPYKEIQAAYNANMPLLTTSRKLCDKTMRNIARIWKEDKKHQSIDFWIAYFAGASKLERRMDNWAKCGDIELLTRHNIFVRTVNELISDNIWSASDD